MAHSSVLPWLFLLLGSYAATSSTGVTVCIDADKGNDNSGCVTGLHFNPCRSLHYAVTNSHSDTTFLLLSDIPLQTVINFTSRHNIILLEHTSRFYVTSKSVTKPIVGYSLKIVQT